MPKKNKPLYLQIKDKIKTYIKENNLEADDALPSENQLVELFSASRVTVRLAIDKLVEENLLYKKKGSGTYIKDLNHSKLISFTEEMKKLDIEFSSKIIDFRIIEPDKSICEILEIDSTEKVYYIKRLRFAENKKMVLEISYMPVNLFPDLSYEILEKSKYEYVERKKGYRIKKSCQEIIPILPDENISILLDISENEPILKVNSKAYLENNKIFEYTIHFYNPKEYNYKVIAER
jgi:GntR family mannosyl-D-glycerate transport/metabolism transcriptional repressor